MTQGFPVQSLRCLNAFIGFPVNRGKSSTCMGCLSTAHQPGVSHSHAWKDTFVLHIQCGCQQIEFNKIWRSSRLSRTQVIIRLIQPSLCGGVGGMSSHDQYQEKFKMYSPLTAHLLISQTRNSVERCLTALGITDRHQASKFNVNVHHEPHSERCYHSQHGVRVVWCSSDLSHL